MKQRGEGRCEDKMWHQKRREWGHRVHHSCAFLVLSFRKASAQTSWDTEFTAIVFSEKRQEFYH